MIDALRETLNITTTENGALSHNSSLDPVLDFFSKCGSLRDNEVLLLELFHNAIHENETLTLKALFYMRDIRGGQGERKSFRLILSYLAQNRPTAILRNIKHIPKYGRFDDIYTLVDYDETRDEALRFLHDQFLLDLQNVSSENKSISLLGKWLKSENTSSPESKKLGAITRKYFKLTRKEYQHALTILRAKIKIVETLMCKNLWSNIAYQNVPSKAMKIYTKAFIKHDAARFEQYLSDVEENKTHIHSATLYPYEIVKSVMSTNDENVLKALNLQWNSLPNYITNTEDQNCLVVADTSGSMYSECGKNLRAIDVAISIALYFAERLQPPYKDYFITFASNPKLAHINGNTIKDKVESIRHSFWTDSTNLVAVFELILESAIKHKLNQNQLPSKIFIISDMQFNTACKSNNVTNFQYIDTLFMNAGYVRPKLVFWNVCAHNDSPVTKDENDCFMISGCSPSILKYALNTQCVTPLDLMLEVLNSSRYDDIY